MSQTIIHVEHISKYYRLGTLGSGRFREDISGLFKKNSSKSNDSPLTDSSSHIWALKDISFNVNEGEVLGFIGNNGAGKSTLLKIISRIIAPTSGSIKGRGRVASLLEVGTGFHGELTGIENIFLNGHILGMNKREIRDRLEEIIDFSGLEHFINTPVKRYSSGMYMRLAFAVAAHLDPEILIVDEVLAVGDAEFQQKCIGKMKEVSRKDGKTVLFVSHNLQALQNICHRAIALHKGAIIDSGAPVKIIADYLKREKVIFLCQHYEDKYSAPGNESIRIKKVELVPEFVDDMKIIDIRTPLNIHIDFWYDTVSVSNLIIGIHLFNLSGECIFDVSSRPRVFESGLMEVSCKVPGNFLNDGSYYVSVVFVRNTTTRLFYFEACLSFDVEDYRENTAWFGKWQGYVRPDFPVNIQSKQF